MVLKVSLTSSLDADAATYIGETLKSPRRTSKFSYRKLNGNRRSSKPQIPAAPNRLASGASLSLPPTEADVKTEQPRSDSFPLINSHATMDQRFLGMPDKNLVRGQMTSNPAFYDFPVLQESPKQYTIDNGCALQWLPDHLNSSDAVSSEGFHAFTSPRRASVSHETSSSFNGWGAEPFAYYLTYPNNPSYGLRELRQQSNSAKHGCSYDQPITQNFSTTLQQLDSASTAITPEQDDVFRTHQDNQFIHNPGSTWYQSAGGRLTRSFPW